MQIQHDHNQQRPKSSLGRKSNSAVEDLLVDDEEWRTGFYCFNANIQTLPIFFRKCLIWTKRQTGAESLVFVTPNSQCYMTVNNKYTTESSTHLINGGHVLLFCLCPLFQLYLHVVLFRADAQDQLLMPLVLL